MALFAKMNQDLQVESLTASWRSISLTSGTLAMAAADMNTVVKCEVGPSVGGHLSKDGQLLLLYCLEVTEVAQVC